MGQPHAGGHGEVDGNGMDAPSHYLPTTTYGDTGHCGRSPGTPLSVFCNDRSAPDPLPPAQPTNTYRRTPTLPIRSRFPPLTPIPFPAFFGLVA